MDKDPESGLSPLAHLIYDALMLLEWQYRGIGNDNRFKDTHELPKKAIMMGIFLFNALIGLVVYYFGIALIVYSGTLACSGSKVRAFFVGIFETLVAQLGIKIIC